MGKSLLVAAAVLLVAAGAGRAAGPDDKLVKDLVTVFKDAKNSPDVRTTAIRALVELGWTGRSALPDLIKLLEDPDEKKAARAATGPYYYAILAVGQMGSGARDAVPALVKAKGMAGAYDQAIDTALGDILRPSSAVAAGMLASLRDPDPSVRLMAAKSLRQYTAFAAAVLPSLAEAAKDPDADVRRVAEESRGLVQQAEVARLTQLLKDKDENVRLLAAKALGRLGKAAASAAPALTEAADKDADRDVRYVAKNALDKVQGKE